MDSKLGAAALMICVLWISCLVIRAENGRGERPMESEEVRLIRDLLQRTSQYGHNLARPVKNVSDDVTIHFALSLVQIMDFDEKNQILTLNVWKHYKWHDEFQTWNASDYGGVDKVTLPSDALWTPDIMLYDNMVKRDIENHQENLRLFSTGEIEWVPYVVYKSACKVDMSNFPFDTQHCALKFGSWTYAAKELDLVFLNNESDFRLDQLIEDIEWRITETSGKRNVKYYNCCPPEKYVDITFHISMSRHPGFYTKFILLPTLLLSGLALLTFWIPPTRTDRSGLGTSLLGSYMLLLILVTSISPPAEGIRFVNYICCMMGLAFVLVLYSVGAFNLCSKTDPVPRWLRKCLVENAVGRICRCLPPSEKKEPDANEPAGNNHLLEAIGSNQDAPEPKKPEKPVRNHAADWLNAVSVIDRIVFIICALYMLICFILFFPRP